MQIALLNNTTINEHKHIQFKKNKLVWKYKENARSFHNVRSVDAFLLSDLFKLYAKLKKWTGQCVTAYFY